MSFIWELLLYPRLTLNLIKHWSNGMIQHSHSVRPLQTNFLFPVQCPHHPSWKLVCLPYYIIDVQWEVQCLREHSPPQCFGFIEIHRPLWWPQTDIWHSGHQENMHINSVWCRSSPSLGWMHCLMCTAGEGIQGLRGIIVMDWVH